MPAAGGGLASPFEHGRTEASLLTLMIALFGKPAYSKLFKVVEEAAHRCLGHDTRLVVLVR